jgi:secondary thiamine-phosphate synthase enzyme
MNMQDTKSTIINVNTSERVCIVDITQDIRKIVSKNTIHNGICYVYVPHTTAAVTINENADPDVKSDIIMGLEAIVPGELTYKHSEGNSPAHIKASLMGSSESLLIENSQLLLGIWQGVYFCEFDGPRKRQVYVKVMG